MRSPKDSTTGFTLKESDIQIQVADWLRLYESARDFLWLAIPNEGKDRGNIVRLMKLIRMGMKPGAGDILLVIRGRAHFLELKTAKGTQSDNQIYFMHNCERLEIPYAVARSFEEAQKIIENWLDARCNAW